MCALARMVRHLVHPGITKGSEVQRSPVRDGRQLGVHDGDRLADGGEGGQCGGLGQPALVQRGQPVHQRLRAQVQQQVRLRLPTGVRVRVRVIVRAGARVGVGLGARIGPGSGSA